MSAITGQLLRLTQEKALWRLAQKFWDEEVEPLLATKVIDAAAKGYSRFPLSKCKGCSDITVAQGRVLRIIAARKGLTISWDNWMGLYLSWEKKTNDQ